jgi:hypothetical protein
VTLALRGGIPACCAARASLATEAARVSLATEAARVSLVTEAARPRAVSVTLGRVRARASIAILASPPAGAPRAGRAQRRSSAAPPSRRGRARRVQRAVKLAARRPLRLLVTTRRADVRGASRRPSAATRQRLAVLIAAPSLAAARRGAVRRGVARPRSSAPAAGTVDEGWENAGLARRREQVRREHGRARGARRVRRA